ncbi:MAG: hypothetical protein AAFX10_05780 [Pseudomonadota bacterium]
MKRVFLLFLLLPFGANAAIIDLGDVTLDTDTGFEWLDLSFTDGKSATQVLGELDTYVGGGWRYASNSEVNQFVLAITGQPFTVSGWSTDYEGDTDAIAAFTGYSEQTPTSFDYVYAWTREDPNFGSLGRYTVRDGNNNAAVIGRDFRRQFISGISLNTTSRFYASWLLRETNVTPVGEPGVLTLLGLGLALTGFAARRRRFE